MRPKPRIVGWPRTVAKLDTVAPDDDLAAEIGLRRGKGEILERISVPDPTIVGKGINRRISIRCRKEACEVGFYEWVPAFPNQDVQEANY